MKWLDNITAAFERGEDIACPYCGSLHTDHGFTIVKPSTRAGHGTIWCNDCGRGVHLSRLTVPAGAKEKTPPNGIKYE